MKQTKVPDHPDAKSPAGAEIRFIMDGPTGNMIHSTVPPGQINRATRHETVYEFWHVLEGKGQIWRSDGVNESVVDLESGVSIDIQAGTAFQYRNTGGAPLMFICISMPPWPGDTEATFVEGPWQPTI
ncbi:cupin domain-containing protein [Roseibium sp. AS2]|uniref:cupin domain-containing protein n=1 Tax=Roseibium sp. AS2 TaxID=3135781 RepID=UPI003175F33A